MRQRGAGCLPLLAAGLAGWFFLRWRKKRAPSRVGACVWVRGRVGGWESGKVGKWAGGLSLRHAKKVQKNLAKMVVFPVSLD